MLDFVPNAVHTGHLRGAGRGPLRRRGHRPRDPRAVGASTDAPKLLEAGRTEFAVMDIHDVGLAPRARPRHRALVAPIVQRPLAAVIAGDRSEVRRPPDLEGGTVGVTGLPSDDAVLDAVLDADGVDPAAVDAGDDRLRLGRGAVGWARGRGDRVLERRGRRPERAGRRRRGSSASTTTVRRATPSCVLVTSKQAREDDPAPRPDGRGDHARATRRARDDPEAALERPARRRRRSWTDGEQQAQLDALLEADAFKRSSCRPGRRTGPSAWTVGRPGPIGERG